MPLDQFVTDLAGTAIHATGHQHVSSCRSVCAEEKTQILYPQMNSKYLSLGSCGKSCLLYNVLFKLTELNEKLDRLDQGPSLSPQWAPERFDTNGDESDNSMNRRKVSSAKNLRMKKSYGADELGKFFVTGPTDAANKPNHFYCRIYRKDGSVLTHGHYEVLKH